MEKEAECIRMIENWSSYEPEHKIDNVAFNKKKVKDMLPILSPKIEKLLETIEALDAEDMKRDGTLYKHMIFSDLTAAGGAKAIGGAFLAHGYNLIYDKSLQIKENLPPSKKNFAILCSTKLFQKDVGIRFRRKVLELFNTRPDNIYGEKVRFVVLDYGYKEGIDLYDIRYIHILETPITRADEKQIVGRGTRFCGQKGLAFDKKEGWPLHIYRYYSTLPPAIAARYSSETLFDIFLKYSGIDIAKEEFGRQLELRCIQSAIDFELTKNIHLYGQDKDSDYYKLVKEVETDYAPVFSFKRPRQMVKKVGVKLEENAPFPCRNGCKGNVMLIPTELMLLCWYTSRKEYPIFKSEYILERKPRGDLCVKIERDERFCKKLNKVWHNPVEYILQNRETIEKAIKELSSEYAYIRDQKKEILAYIQKVIEQIPAKPSPPPKIMNYSELQGFIKLQYKKLIWPEIELENMCVAPKKSAEKATEKEGGKTSFQTVEFTPTQVTVQNFFQPSTPYKGLLLWHSVGTGKTCSGISVATNTFEKEGYTILWVTRHTLRGDVWKNMFQQICSISLQEKGQPIDVDAALKKPLDFLPSNWLMPITYKQFSNMLAGKNLLHKEMIRRNGEEDPLKKTLIIIDEAHKLLSADMKPQEKPDFKVLKKQILHSYETSGKDSVKLLLMTATPYSEDPMQFIQLLNLMRSKEDQLPESFTEFKEKFLDEEGDFRTPLGFLNKVAGYISYLNRETDLRQFAHPIFHQVPVPISLSTRKKLEKQIAEEEAELHHSTEVIAYNEGQKKKAKLRMKKEKGVLEEECKKIKDKMAKAKCKEHVKSRLVHFEKDLFQEADGIIHIHEQKVKHLKQSIHKTKHALKNYKETDPSQERMLEEKCLTT